MFTIHLPLLELLFTFSPPVVWAAGSSEAGDFFWPLVSLLAWATTLGEAELAGELLDSASLALPRGWDCLWGLGAAGVSPWASLGWDFLSPAAPVSWLLAGGGATSCASLRPPLSSGSLSRVSL